MGADEEEHQFPARKREREEGEEPMAAFPNLHQSVEQQRPCCSFAGKMSTNGVEINGYILFPSPANSHW